MTQEQQDMFNSLCCEEGDTEECNVASLKQPAGPILYNVQGSRPVLLESLTIYGIGPFTMNNVVPDWITPIVSGNTLYIWVTGSPPALGDYNVSFLPNPCNPASTGWAGIITVYIP